MLSNAVRAALDAGKAKRVEGGFDHCMADGVCMLCA